MIKLKINRHNIKYAQQIVAAASNRLIDLSGASLRDADLSRADLNGADLSRADLSGASLNGASLRGADLKHADLNGADLNGASLSRANLSWADLSGADLNGASLKRANLSNANLRGASLRDAGLRGANLSHASLRDADLSDASLRDADLRDANLRGAIGLKQPGDTIAEWFKFEDGNLIVYKTFNSSYPSRSDWITEPGAVVSENVNPLPTNDCGCGINVATLEWVKNNMTGDIWKCHIAPLDMSSIVVPYNSNGKIRVGRVTLVEIVK